MTLISNSGSGIGSPSATFGGLFCATIPVTLIVDSLDVACIAAKISSDFQKACEQKNEEAETLDKLLQPLHSALFIESNPSPVKYAASLLGLCSPAVRLPLVEIKEETKKKVSEALKVAKLL